MTNQQQNIPQEGGGVALDRRFWLFLPASASESNPESSSSLFANCTITLLAQKTSAFPYIPHLPWWQDEPTCLFYMFCDSEFSSLQSTMIRVHV